MSQQFSSEHYQEAAAAIQNLSGFQPSIALILGSGLSALAEAVENPLHIECSQIPHWPVSTVAGHSGRLVFGKLQGREVLVMQGRVHYYEGYSAQQITFPVRVMHMLGIGNLIVTNAAGGLNPAFRAGDLMLISDHLNFLGLAGQNPLRGPNDERIGPRFPDMTSPYDLSYRRLAHQVARDAGFTLQEGTYAYVGGPSYETPAEIRFLQTIGADAVGMSTAPSVVVARHAGIRVLGLSTITNMAIADSAPELEVSHEDVLQVGAQVVPRLTTLIHGMLRLI